MSEEATWLANPYEGCLHKLARAREHRDRLADMCRAWIEPQLMEPVVEMKDDPPRWEYRLPELEPPPLILGAVVSDVLAQLRSTLDHLAVYLVWSRGHRAKVRSAKFPVCWVEAEWSKSLREALPGVRGAVIDAIRDLQPFASDPLLGVLAEASNADKHRYLLPVGLVISKEMIPTPGGVPREGRLVSLRSLVKAGEWLDGGQPVAEAVMDPPHAQPPPVLLDLSAAAAFGSFEHGGPGPTTGLLKEASDRIEQLVLRLAELDGHRLMPLG